MAEYQEDPQGLAGIQYRSARYAARVAKAVEDDIVGVRAPSTPDSWSRPSNRRRSGHAALGTDDVQVLARRVAATSHPNT